jgi:hypothetical protein
MAGQWSNFIKNFGKAIYANMSPYIPVAKKLVGAVGVGYDIFNNLNKLDDPNRSTRDKTENVIKAALAPTSLIPGIGTIINNVGNAVVDSAGYIQDVMEGKKDPPPMPADINMRSNPIGTLGNRIFNSTPFKNFFGNF